MKLETIGSDVVVGEPRPLRLVVRPRVPIPPGPAVINSRRQIGLAWLRIAFGAIWAVDASLKWQPAFQANFQQLLSGVAQGQPGFLSWWFGLWQFVVSGRAPIFGILTASTETYLAVALLTGFARKFTYTVGILYGLFVWSVAEGFGGPYMPGTTTDVGAAIIYSFLFIALLLVDGGRLSVDSLIVRRFAAWSWVSEFRRGGHAV
jgi:nitrite reductase (NO-forming)